MPDAAAPFAPERLLNDLLPLPGDGVWWVAFSGGADSMALLHALAVLQAELPATIKALHVDHGLHPDSHRWSDFCTETCARWAVPIRVEQVQLQANGRGVEAEARRARYAAAASLLNAGDVLLTAHHADDQAETVILNLLRGSGVDGLAGMPAVRPLGKGLLARPLLPYPGASLRRYLAAQGMEWIEDASNQDLAYDRNFVRHRLIPVLECRWPGSWRNFGHSATYCREASDFIATACRGLLEPCLRHDRVLDLACLRSRIGEQGAVIAHKQVIRHWLRKVRAPSLPRERLQELLRQLDHAGRESHLAVEWNGWQLRHYHDRLWLLHEAELPPCPSLPWNTTARLDLGGTLGILELSGRGTRPEWHLRVAPRCGGERIASLADGSHRGVKQVLQEAQVPPWLRNSVPVVWEDDRVVAVGTLARDHEFAARLERHGLSLKWRPANPLLADLFDVTVTTEVDPDLPLG
jgi:tRNA(Ile)-lysidine synthase